MITMDKKKWKLLFRVKRVRYVTRYVVICLGVMEMKMEASFAGLGCHGDSTETMCSV